MARGRQKTTKEVIIQAKKIHHNKYDYSKVEYKTTGSKVCIICPKHGEFWQSMNSHIDKGYGCKKCSNSLKKNNTFLVQSIKKHKNKYDYSKVNYIRNNVKICIICPEHGKFWQTPQNHLLGSGCPKCAIKSRSMKQEEFIVRARKVHSTFYDYSKVNYKSLKKKVCIICPEHGKFWQTPQNHILRQQGCPKCNSSHGEVQIRTWLEEHDVDYIQEKRFNDCINPRTDRTLPFDFYLPNINTCIEFDGIQHFFEGVGSNVGKHVISLKEWYQISFRDSIKSQYCFRNNIKLIRISHKQFLDIENILNNIFKEEYHGHC